MKAFISDSVNGRIIEKTETKFDSETGYNYCVIDGERFYYDFILFI